MRLLPALIVTALLLGCHSTHSSRDEVGNITEALERPITPDEARQMLRNSRSSHLDAFLKRLREGDELWYYRTYAWENQRGGEGGIAIVRNGKVVDHMLFFTFDQSHPEIDDPTGPPL